MPYTQTFVAAAGASTGDSGFGKAKLVITRFAVDGGGGLILAPSVSDFGVPLGLSQLVSKVQSWFDSLFRFFALSITGPTSLTLPDSSSISTMADAPIVYDVTLTSPVLVDDAFEDGSYSVRYCSVGMVNDDGVVYDADAPVRCFNSWTATFSTIVPKAFDDYVVVAIMTESKGVYDTIGKKWSFGAEEVIVRDALNVKTKAPIPGASSLPQAQSLQNFVQKFWSWIVGIFGG